MHQDAHTSGWSLVADRDEAASVIATLVDLDPDREYTQSELADAADVPLKTLYLGDTLDALVDIGMLVRVDDETDETEAQYTLNEDSDALDAAARFDRAITEQPSAGAE
mgnify:CR=1 FL=1|jgi:DNA-binding HxlR family transcriptional regulator